MPIGKRIKELRGKLSLSQTEFGKPLGISQTTIAGYERGTVPSMGIKSICNYYHVREQWLVDGTGPIFEEPETVTGEVERLAEKYHLPETAVAILRGYLALNESERQVLADLVHKMAVTEQESAKKKETDGAVDSAIAIIPPGQAGQTRTG